MSMPDTPSAACATASAAPRLSSSDSIEKNTAPRTDHPIHLKTHGMRALRQWCVRCTCGWCLGLKRGQPTTAAYRGAQVAEHACIARQLARPVPRHSPW